MSVSAFERNVFVNCPFDDDYVPLLRPLLFTVVHLGFTPRIASERSDSGEMRLSKICSLIEESRYGIHDLSRLQATTAGEYYRLNMPFEFGIDYGCRLFAGDQYHEKRFLLLAREPHEYRRAFSDVSGADIKYHRDDGPRIVRQVRDWFLETVGLTSVPGASTIWQDFNEFMSVLWEERKSEGFSGEDLEMMPVAELLQFMDVWVENRKASQHH